MSRGSGRRRLGRALGLTLAAAVVALASSLVYLLAVYPGSRGSASGRAVVVEVPWGGDLWTVARNAAASGAVRGPRRFAAYLLVSGAAFELEAGGHRVRDDWPARDVAEALTRPGQALQVRVTLREGLSRLAYAEELSRKGIVPGELFLKAAADPAFLASLELEGESAEGYLFPDTYLMEPASKAEDVVARLVANFRRRVGPLAKQKAGELEGLHRGIVALEASLAEKGAARGSAEDSERRARFSGLHAAVILASVVEAETPHGDERRRVAKVFLNRLFAPGFPFRRLQADPTVRYGCEVEPDRAPSCAQFDGRLARRHLADGQNRYNTYRFASLPPGPIGNPSLEAIQAVLEPAATEELYFVARPDGRHEFSVTLAEHNAAVARYRGASGGDASPPGDASP